MDEFTPEELKLLVDSGELTEQDLLLLSKRDAQTAGMMMMEGGKVDVQGGLPLPGPKLMSGALDLAKAGFNKLPPLSSAGIGGLAAQMGVDAIGSKLGLPWWITGPLSHRVGRMGQGSGPKPAPKPARPAPAPKPWGQRSAPVAGSKPLGPGLPPKGSFKTPGTPQNSTNLERHGNVTNPGPDAHKGGGGPSRPSGPPPRNPANETSGFKGPLGDDSNYRDVKPTPGPTKSVGAQLNSSDRRSASRNSEMYEAMKAGLPDASNERKLRNVIDSSRKPPTAAFDEADKRKVEFGGLNPSSTGYRRPQDRKPLSKREIEQLIQNILSLSK